MERGGGVCDAQNRPLEPSLTVTAVGIRQTLLALNLPPACKVEMGQRLPHGRSLQEHKACSRQEALWGVMELLLAGAWLGDPLFHGRLRQRTE